MPATAPKTAPPAKPAPPAPAPVNTPRPSTRPAHNTSAEHGRRDAGAKHEIDAGSPTALAEGKRADANDREAQHGPAALHPKQLQNLPPSLRSFAAPPPATAIAPTTGAKPLPINADRGTVVAPAHEKPQPAPEHTAQETAAATAAPALAATGGATPRKLPMLPMASTLGSAALAKAPQSPTKAPAPAPPAAAGPVNPNAGTGTATESSQNAATPKAAQAPAPKSANTADAPAKSHTPGGTSKQEAERGAGAGAGAESSKTAGETTDTPSGAARPKSRDAAHPHADRSAHTAAAATATDETNASTPAGASTAAPGAVSTTPGTAASTRGGTVHARPQLRAGDTPRGRSVAVAPLPGEAPRAAEAHEEARGHHAAGATSLARIANAEPSVEQATALAQAALIEQDSLQAESRVSQMAAQRQQALQQFLAGTRASLNAFFLGNLLRLQAYIHERQASAMAAVTGLLAQISMLAAASLQSAQAWLTQAQMNLQTRLQNASGGLQERVSGIASRLGSFIDSFSLPAIPGIAQIRSVATGLLSGGAGLINRALGRATQAVGAIAALGFNAMGALLQGFGAAVGQLLNLVSTALMNLMQTLSGMLNLLLNTLQGVLNAVLNGVVLPLFTRVGALGEQWIMRLRQRAITALRENRRRALEALADSVAPTGGSDAGPADTPRGDNNRNTNDARDMIAHLRSIRMDALQRAQRIVHLFDLLAGGALSGLMPVVTALGAHILTVVTRMVTTAISGIGGMLASLLQTLYGLFSHFAQTLLQMGQALIRMLSDLGTRILGLFSHPVESVVQFATGIWDRVSGMVRRLIDSFIRAVTGAPVGDVHALAGEYAPNQVGLDNPGGPIVIPDPGTIERIIRIAAPIVVAAVTALVALVGPEVALVIIILVAIALLFLLGLLLWWLLKWILENIIGPKPPPKQPKKRVIRVDPKKLELGVGGFDLRTAATISPGTPRNPPLTWKINPGGSPPAGVSVIGTGRRVKLRSVHPAHGTVLGGTDFTVRAALTANPLDFADSKPITLVQILEANYSANPPLANVPSLIPGNFPPNTGEPNRDGISGNTVDVNAFPRPSGRSMRLEFRRRLGASASSMTVKPSSQTGDIGLRIRDRDTGATLDETLPSTAGGATLMADLAINAVPTKVGALAQAALNGPYGVNNTFTFTPSDTVHPPLTRIVGELITFHQDQLNLGPPNGGYNPAYRHDLAVPADTWTDQLVRGSGLPNVSDGRIAMDVNRFVGPGVPQLPQRHSIRQRFVYVAWHGGGSVVSRVFDDGIQRFTLVSDSPANGFTTEHIFPGASAPVRAEPYVGPPLISLTGFTVTPNAPGATALAADGASTANVSITSNIGGQSVNWRVITGDLSFTSTNPVTLPAPGVVQAGSRNGRLKVRAEDTVYPNRRIDGVVPVAKVALRNIRAADRVVPAGTLSTTVSLDAEPGGRTVNWSVDAAAAAAGVTVTPASTGPGAPAMTVTVTRPAAFTGRVTVTAADGVLTSRTARVRIKFT